MNKKLETELETSTIKQTRDKTVEASPIGSAPPGSRVKIEPIRFKQDAVNKVRKENYTFGEKRFLFIPFKVSKDSHQRGVFLKILKGKSGEKDTHKIYHVRFWFNGKARYPLGWER